MIINERDYDSWLSAVTDAIHDNTFPSLPGINKSVLEKALVDGDLESITELSNDISGQSRLLAEIRREPAKSSICWDCRANATLFRTLAFLLLVKCHQIDAAPPLELCFLIERALGLEPSSRVRNPVAYAIACREFAVDLGAGIREVARKAGVSHSTVSRWYHHGDLKNDSFALMFGRNKETRKKTSSTGA